MAVDRVRPIESAKPIQLRFADGELQGRILWVENGSVKVHVRMAPLTPGVTRTLHYRREGPFLRFVEEELGPSIMPAGTATP